jgi:two-component system chemotaxis response regulator CheB
VTTDALLEGAFDFILKPSGKDCTANRQQLRDALTEKIAAFRQTANRHPSASRRATRHRIVASDDVVETAPTPSAACRAVVLATSTGGPRALKVVLPRLPAGLAVPVFVVQHMPAQYTSSLAMRLNEISDLEILEAKDGIEVVAGKVFVAPGGKQMKLESGGSSLWVRVNEDPPENGVRPSADYLLRSIADVLKGEVLAVIMTGMGRDGLAGCQVLKQMGGYVFAQSQDDCVVYGMPKAVIDEGLADRTLPLGKIAPAIARHVKRSLRRR